MEAGERGLAHQVVGMAGGCRAFWPQGQRQSQPGHHQPGVGSRVSASQSAPAGPGRSAVWVALAGFELLMASTPGKAGRTGPPAGSHPVGGCGGKRTPRAVSRSSSISARRLEAAREICSRKWEHPPRDSGPPRGGRRCRTQHQRIAGAVGGDHAGGGQTGQIGALAANRRCGISSTTR